MELVTASPQSIPIFELLLELERQQKLIYYASDAAIQMEFETEEEFLTSVNRSLEICIHAGFDPDDNFKKFYKCSADGISFDWKLSSLAYQLICLNGSCSNLMVAKMQIDLIHSNL